MPTIGLGPLRPAECPFGQGHWRHRLDGAGMIQRPKAITLAEIRNERITSSGLILFHRHLIGAVAQAAFKGAYLDAVFPQRQTCKRHRSVAFRTWRPFDFKWNRIGDEGLCHVVRAQRSGESTTLSVTGIGQEGGGDAKPMPSRAPGSRMIFKAKAVRASTLANCGRGRLLVKVHRPLLRAFDFQS